jgi:hypothetical protein
MLLINDCFNKIKKECYIFIESIIESIHKEFSQEKLKQCATRGFHGDILKKIDSMLVDCMMSCQSKKITNKPFVPFMIASMDMAIKGISLRKWASECVAVRLIHTNSLMNKYRNGEKNLYLELKNRGILK